MTSESRSPETDHPETGKIAQKTPKGEATRQLILETALAMFRERGYEETTMRAVAKEAGVSVGNAYYYFASKEHLIQAFYARSQAEHLAACQPLLEEKTDFKDRLRAVLEAKIETSMPYHRFAGLLFKTAADPKSPLSPFSPESQPTREEATELMAKVVEGARLKLPSAFAEEVPQLLWLYLMGIILFWVHDSSPECRRTYRLIDHTVDVVGWVIPKAGNPFLRPLSGKLLRLLEELRGSTPKTDGDEL